MTFTATTPTLTVRIPMCPVPELSPNARPHHMHKASAVRFSRNLASACTMEATGKMPMSWVIHSDPANAIVNITIGWAKGRKTMDGDNALAACKAFLDGVADGLGVNDKKWTYPPVAQVRDPEGMGYVEITLEGIS